MRKKIVQVVDYDPSWPRKFETEAKLIRGALGALATRISHVGSTSVVGLAAKSIIDILVEVSDLAALDAQREEMESIGYVARGEHGIPGRRYFQKGGSARSHHLHAFESGNPELVRHLAFRDYLRKNDGAREEYGRLKKASCCRIHAGTKQVPRGKNSVHSVS